MKSIFFEKIIWPVDLQEDSKNQKEVLFALGAITRPTQARVEPVYILHPPYSQMGADFTVDLEPTARLVAEKRLAELTASVDMPNMSTGKILINRAGSVRKDVQTLLDYAKQNDADLIVVATHARRGLPRMVLGSFAETLVLNSTIPVVTVNPEAKVRERISSILLPTTFEDCFRASFERVVEFAKILGAKLTLFHKEPLVPFHAMAPQIYQIIADEVVRRTEVAKKWQHWANQYGVPTELILDDQPGYPIRAIENLANEKNYDLIAIPTQASALSAAISGSLARGMMRVAPCPVWVLKVEERPQ